jgi:large subunit ribosomal protein L5
MREKFFKETVPALKQKFGFSNVMQVPRLEKIVLNMGVGKAVQDAKLIDEAVTVLRDISGQKPVVTPRRPYPISSCARARPSGAKSP